MLGNKEAAPTVAVKDLKTAARFYSETLGLKRTGGEDSETIIFATGKGSLLVYVSRYAGTNQATDVTWTVDDVDAEVKALESKGVRFEDYDMPGMKREGHVHVMNGNMRAAWFKDPDGNIHALTSSRH